MPEPFLSFRLKTILGVALIEAVLLLLLVWSSLDYLHRSAEEELAVRAATASRLLARMSQDAILTTDLARLESIAREAILSPEVVYVRIRDQERVLVSSGDSRALEKPFAADYEVGAINDGVYDVAADLIEGSYHYGRVELGLSLARSQALVQDAQTRLELIAIIEMLLVALFSFVLSTYLIRGLTRLTRGATALKEGNLGVQVDLGGQDELAVAGQAFNAMSRRLAESQRQNETEMQRVKTLGQQLRDKEIRLRNILNAAVDGFITINQQGIIEDINRAATRIFGYADEELIGRNVSCLMPEPDAGQHDQYIARFVDDGKSRIIGNGREMEGLRKDGSIFPIDLAVSQIKLENQHLFLGLVRDISERKISEHELREAKETAEQASEAKSRFLAHMSHEIRSPLNAILGSIGLMLDGDLDRQTRVYAKTAQRAGHGLLGLISEILDFSKIEAGRLELDLRRFELSELLTETANLVAFRAQDRDLQTALVLEPGIHDSLIGDPTRIRQILVNLVDNAIKFTRSGAVVLIVEKLEHRNDGLWVRFTVEDSGIGIPDQIQASLFDEFQQADSSDSTEHGGAGLGLSICKGLVTLMGGAIGLESKPGQGSRFWFDLPLEKSTEVGGPFSRPVRRTAQRVLVVGLHDLIFMPLQRLCEKHGDHVERVSNKTMAEQKLPDAFDVLLLDDSLAESDAAELLEQARNNSVGHRVLLGSASAVKSRAWMLESLANDQLVMPLLVHRLVEGLGLDPGNLDEHIIHEMDVVEPVSSLPAARILLADDSPANQMVALDLLTNAGYQVDAVADGRGAIEAVQRQSYDLVLMDLRMPVMDGFEAARRIRALAAGKVVPIIALSANVLSETIQQCLEAGMDAYLAKPLDKQKLLAMVHRYLSMNYEKVPDLGESTDQPDSTRIDLMDDRIIGQLIRDTSPQKLPAMLKQFLSEVRDRGGRVAESVETLSLEVVADEAHTLKSCAGTFGASRLCASTSALEVACEQNNIEDIHVIAKELENIMVATLNRYQKRIDEISENGTEQ